MTEYAFQKTKEFYTAKSVKTKKNSEKKTLKTVRYNAVGGIRTCYLGFPGECAGTLLSVKKTTTERFEPGPIGYRPIGLTRLSTNQIARNLKFCAISPFRAIGNRAS